MSPSPDDACVSSESSLLWYSLLGRRSAGDGIALAMVLLSFASGGFEKGRMAKSLRLRLKFHLAKNKFELPRRSRDLTYEKTLFEPSCSTQRVEGKVKPFCLLAFCRSCASWVSLYGRDPLLLTSEKIRVCGKRASCTIFAAAYAASLAVEDPCSQMLEVYLSSADCLMRTWIQ